MVLWHLQLLKADSEKRGIVLCNENGPIRSSNDQPLGLIVEVCTPKKGKYTCEGVTVSIKVDKLATCKLCIITSQCSLECRQR